jgi:hypothetical protein
MCNLPLLMAGFGAWVTRQALPITCLSRRPASGNSPDLTAGPYRVRDPKKICFHGIIASEGFVLPDPAGGFRIGPAAADTHLSGSPTLEIKLVILKSVDGDPGARGAFVQVQPSPLDVAAHHVNLSVR